MSFRDARALALVVALATAGCASVEPLTVAPAPTDDLRVAAPRCDWSLVGVNDARTSDDQGKEGLHPVTIEDLPGLVDKAVRHVIGERAGRALELDLLKAYAGTRHVSRMYVLALRAHVGDESFVVRGQSTGMFWSDGEGGVRDAAREALANAMRELVKGLDARCGAERTATTP
ncbi:MAG TPA: hypothetical protein VFL14_15810 [Xanthomonadales bacterium]|nr:hypothetical protein [Xanthomonadales bacterium]